MFLYINEAKIQDKNKLKMKHDSIQTLNIHILQDKDNYI